MNNPCILEVLSCLECGEPLSAESVRLWDVSGSRGSKPLEIEPRGLALIDLLCEKGDGGPKSASTAGDIAPGERRSEKLVAVLATDRFQDEPRDPVRPDEPADESEP